MGRARHLLGGLDGADRGTIRIGDTDLTALDDQGLGSPSAAGRSASSFQFHHLLPEFSAVENAEMPVRIARLGAREARRRAEALLGRVGRERLAHRPGTLSGGEQQRVAVARAVAGSPRALLADEPTGDLDRATGRRLHETIRALVRSHGLTVVVVTHNEEVARACDRVLALEGGRLVPA